MYGSTANTWWSQDLSPGLVHFESMLLITARASQLPHGPQ